MKLILLAAAAVIATPALAQTSGSTGTSSPTSNGGQGTAADSAVPNNTQGTMSTTPSVTTPAPANTAPMQDSMTAPQTTQTQTMPAPATDGSDPVGGYQPMTPSSPAPAGATVTYQQAPSPDQAYPAPAPMAKYPICKKGEFDNCMQGRNSTHSSEVRGRRRR